VDDGLLLTEPACEPIIHTNQLFCGWYVLQYLLATYNVHRPDLWPEPIDDRMEAFRRQSMLPRKLVRLLGEHQIPASIVVVGSSDRDREDFLMETVRETKHPVVLYTHGRAYLAPHLIAVAGVHPRAGTYYAYDPRHRFAWNVLGTKSSDVPDLPIGNRELPREQLFSEWFGPASIALMNWLCLKLTLDGIYDDDGRYVPPLERYQAVVLR
jgi:hypothetical protein